MMLVIIDVGEEVMVFCVVVCSGVSRVVLY